MTNTSLLTSPAHRSSSSAHLIVKLRSLQAAVFTAVAAVLGVGIIAAFGKVGLLVAAMSLPVPLLLLWLSSDVLRSDEKSS